jgi:ankyrin repeat protein
MHRTLLSWAAGNGHEAVVKSLLERRLSPSSPDDLGRPPISYAAEAGHETIVKILLENNVPHDLWDGIGRTPLSYAAGNGQEGAVERLIHIDAKQSRTYEMPPNVKQNSADAFETGSESSAEKKGLSDTRGPADLESRDKDGYTPLIWAAKGGHRKVVIMLLDEGANINVKDVNDRSVWEIVGEQMKTVGPVDYSNLQDVYTLLKIRRTDGQLLTAAIPENYEVDSAHTASVFYFLSNWKKDYMCRRFKVRDILDNVKAQDFGLNPDFINCKWVHIPANNVRALCRQC